VFTVHKVLNNVGLHEGRVRRQKHRKAESRDFTKTAFRIKGIHFHRPKSFQKQALLSIGSIFCCICWKASFETNQLCTYWWYIHNFSFIVVAFNL